MMRLVLIVGGLLLLAGCLNETPTRMYVSELPPPIKNQVETIAAAADLLIRDLLARNQGTQRLTVAFLPVENNVLEAGVSDAILNALQAELLAQSRFSIQKDYDLRSVKQILASNEKQRAFFDNSMAQQIARYTRADAIVTTEVKDAVQYWSISVSLTPVNSNVLQANATCYLPKRVVINSQIFR